MTMERRVVLTARGAMTSLVLVLAVFVAFTSAASAQTRKELRVGVPGMVATLDPVASVDGAGPLIARQVFDTLVAYREGTTDVDPALATRWAVSRDGLTWTFTLRDGVRFHDGSPVTPAEVAASFQRAQSRDGAVWPALLRGRPGVVKEVRAADAHSVQFILVQPYAPLLTVLAHPGFGIARSGGASDGRAVLVGTGPFRVV